MRRQSLFGGTREERKTKISSSSDSPPVAGYVKWHTAGELMYTDAAKTTLAIDGDLVYVWADRSGYGDDWVQATSGIRGTYRLAATGLYNRKSVELGSSRGYTTTVGTNLPGAYTVYCVYAPITAANGNRRMLNGASVNWLIGPYSQVYSLYAGSGFIQTSGINGIAIASEPVLITAKRNTGGTAEAFKNSVSLGTSGGASSLTSGIGVGATGVYPEAALCYLLETIAFPSEHNSTERGLMEDWLKTRWGIGVLPIWSTVPQDPAATATATDFNSFPHAEEFTTNADIVISAVGLYRFNTLTENGNATWVIWRVSDGAIMTSKTFSNAGGYSIVMGSYLYQAHSYTLPAGNYRVGSYGQDRRLVGNGIRHGSTMNGKLSWAANPSYNATSGTSMPTLAASVTYQNFGMATFLGI